MCLVGYLLSIWHEDYVAYASLLRFICIWEKIHRTIAGQVNFNHLLRDDIDVVYFCDLLFNIRDGEGFSLYEIPPAPFGIVEWS